MILKILSLLSCFTSVKVRSIKNTLVCNLLSIKMNVNTVDEWFDIPDKYFRAFGFSVVKPLSCTSFLRRLWNTTKLLCLFLYIFTLSFLVISNFIYIFLVTKEYDPQKIIYIINVPVTILGVIGVYSNKTFISELILEFKEIFRYSTIEDHYSKDLRLYINIFGFICKGTIIIFIIRILKAVSATGVNTLGLDALWTPINNAFIVNLILTTVGIINAVMLFASEVTIRTIIMLISISFDHLNEKIQILSYVEHDRKMK